MSELDPTDPIRFDISKFVVISGWLLTLVVCGALIFIYGYLVITREGEPPSSIKEQATLAIGFLFGSCVTLVKDFIQKK